MYVYLVYGLDYDDSDIISVPDRICDEMEDIGQEFCNWLARPNLPEEYYVYTDGKKYVNCETDGFVQWLNKYVLCEGEQASIIAQHISYKDGCPMVDF